MPNEGLATSRALDRAANPVVRARDWNVLRHSLTALVVAVLFHLAFEIPALNCVVLLYALGLIELSKVASARVAFRLGFLSGVLVFAPQLSWFWKIFGPAAICLWAILSFY